MKFIMLVSVILLAACTPSTRPIEFSGLRPNMEIIQPARPQPLNLKPISVELLDRQTILKMASDPDFREQVGMSLDDYEKIQDNLIDILRYIEIQKAIIEYYEKVTRLLAE
jgi:hypothetical protein